MSTNRTVDAPHEAPPAIPAAPAVSPPARFQALRLDPKGPAAAALRRGDRLGLLQALAVEQVLDLATMEPRALFVCQTLAELALELRRQSVAVIGDAEAFVRHTPKGSLLQIIRPVVLGLADKTLYQITQRRPVCREPSHMDQPCYGQLVAKRGGHRGHENWEDVVLGDAHTAAVTYPGYLALNAVAGCAVGLPPTVMVDQEARTNPFVHRRQRPGGRLGSVERVVITVNVVGPSPATGNPIVVNYTLDYEPDKDLLHMLAATNKYQEEDCKLVTEPPEIPDGWAYMELHEGVGYLYRLAAEKIREAYAEYINIQANAVKKAQTVARRNAMKSHPALGIQNVVIGPTKQARVPVIGWAGDERAMQQWQEIMERLSRGLALPEDLGVIDISESYEPEAAPTGDVEIDRHELTPEQAERNALVAYIDEGLTRLTPRQIAALNYEPAGPVEALQAVKNQLNELLDH